MLNSIRICGAGMAQAHAGLPTQEQRDTLMALYYGSTPPTLRRVPHYARMGLYAALQVMQTAGWHKAEITDAGSTALIIATAYSGVQMNMDFMDSLLDAGPRLASPTAFSHAVNNMGAGLLSLLLGIQGPCQTISQFELSLAGAIEAAMVYLHSGRVQRVLLGVMDETDDRFYTCCPEVHHGALLPEIRHKPWLENALFFCAELASTENTPQNYIDMRIAWHDATGEELTPAVPGATSLGYAVQVYTAWRTLHKGEHIQIWCQDNVHGHSACIDIRRP